MGRPLSNMLEAKTPERLIEIANDLDDRGGLGFLLSGGCDRDGSLPLGDFLRAIESIKTTTKLKINAHIGFPRKDAIEAIVATGIDAFSITYPMSQDLGRAYFGIEDALGRYSETLRALENQGAKRAISHALIGLGNAAEEARGLGHLRELNPSALVVIAFTPLKGTPLEGRPSTPDSQVVSFLESVHQAMPETKLVLGCMRSRGRSEMERYLIEKILDGIVLPNDSVLKALDGEITVEKRDGCCALYL